MFYEMDWIVTISEDNLQKALDYNLIGLPSRCQKIIKRVRREDYVLFYVSKKKAGYGGPRASVSEFGPIAYVEGEAFYDDSPIWNSKTGERFPWRARVRFISTNRVKAKELVSELDFIRDKPGWGLFFLTGIREISGADFSKIAKALGVDYGAKTFS